MYCNCAIMIQTVGQHTSWPMSCIQGGTQYLHTKVRLYPSLCLLTVVCRILLVFHSQFLHSLLSGGLDISHISVPISSDSLINLLSILAIGTTTTQARYCIHLFCTMLRILLHFVVLCCTLYCSVLCCIGAEHFTFTNIYHIGLTWWN